MKTIVTLLVVTAASSHAALFPSMPVVDAALSRQIGFQHDATTKQLNALVEQQDKQIKLLEDQLDEIRLQSEIRGDPAMVRDLAGFKAVQGSISGTTADRASTGLDPLKVFGAAYRIYSSIDEAFSDPKGESRKRSSDLYAPVAAIIAVTRDQDSAEKAAAPRREAIRQGALETLNQIRSATTDAEVQKLQAVLLAQQLELNAIDHELFLASQKVLVRDVEARNARERRTIARSEERLADAEAGVSGFTNIIGITFTVTNNAAE